MPTPVVALLADVQLLANVMPFGQSITEEADTAGATEQLLANVFPLGQLPANWALVELEKPNNVISKVNTNKIGMYFFIYAYFTTSWKIYNATPKPSPPAPLHSNGEGRNHTTLCFSPLR